MLGDINELKKEIERQNKELTELRVYKDSELEREEKMKKEG